MAVSLGNLALLLDISSPRSLTLDRKPRPVVLVDAILKRDISSSSSSASSSCGCSYASEGEVRGRVVVARGKSNSEQNGVDFDAESSDEEGGIGDGDEFEFEKKIRRRVKEFEERRELEKKAEELQGSFEDGGEVTEEEKRMRVRKELEKVAKEQAERRATAQLMFDLGQKAYGRGMYGRAIEFLEGALTIIPRPTLFGGEIQIWLAMAYEANNRHKDCIALYKQLEKSHPSISIRRQAAELRYILQAPKLKITQEEMVTIPLIGSSYDSYAGTWSDKNKDRKNGSVNNPFPSSRDNLLDFLVWRPPAGLGKNRAFWVGLTIWLGLVGAALFIQR
ncbi:uncharacterized protein [Cicer arietinum]|uniref:Uncharacterized protein LOC101490539 n=1 Tax=Cicer arietinum TaxID=3827 RepID=A0A1S2YTH9_CICAR|nr:uncharacterized protein LOC101490539 [Cicer arietinum]